MREKYRLRYCEEYVVCADERAAFRAQQQRKKTATQWVTVFVGGDCWTRTSDLLRVKQAL